MQEALILPCAVCSTDFVIHSLGRGWSLLLNISFSEQYLEIKAGLLKGTE